MEFIQSLFSLIWLVTLIAFIVFWRKKVNAKKSAGENYADDENYKHINKIKKFIGIACIVSFVIAGAIPIPKNSTVTNNVSNNDDIKTEEIVGELLPVVEKYSGKYDRNTVAHRVTLINDTSSARNNNVVDHPLYSNDWYDEGDMNNVHILGKSQIFWMDKNKDVSGNSTMYLIKNRFKSSTNGNMQTIIMNGYDKSTGKNLLFKVLYTSGTTKSLLERSATITIQEIDTKKYLVGEGTWLFSNTKYSGDGSNAPKAEIFAIKNGNTDKNMYYVAAEMIFYIVTGQKYFGDCDPYASSGSVNEGDDFVYSNFFTQDLYDRCDGKEPYDQKPNLENAQQNNFQPALREVALGSFQDEYVTNLGDSDSTISQKSKNAPEILKNGIKAYKLPYCIAYVKDDKVQMMICSTFEGETESGIGIGKNFKIEKVLAAYGNGYVKSYYQGRDIYEYKTSSKDGKPAIISIAVNTASKCVDYIVMYYLNGELKPSQGIVLN